MDARKSNAPGATRDNVDKSQGGKGWPQTQSTESGLLQARRIQEVSKISSILSRTQGQPQQPQGPVKEASLADIGKAFKEQLKADLAQGE